MSATAEQIAAQDAHRERIHFTREMLDVWLRLFNDRRAEAGLGPVTLRIPEEQ